MKYIEMKDENIEGWQEWLMTIGTGKDREIMMAMLRISRLTGVLLNDVRTLDKFNRTVDKDNIVVRSLFVSKNLISNRILPSIQRFLQDKVK